MAARKVFMTGYPGFIARWLSEEMLRRKPGTAFTFLVQDKFAGQARHELEALQAKPVAKGAKLELLVGDITRPRLGLSEADYGRVLAEATDVFHLAAIYDLHVPEPVARQVNVEGTRAVVELCKAARKLAAFVYYSTCYVAGRRVGPILETELEHAAGFKNHYESTKYEAERIVRAAMDQVPTIIIRPGIVVGHSQTGETQKFDGPYLPMILIDKLKLLQLPLPYLGPCVAEANLVPIDYVVEGGTALWAKEGTTGKCYAFADPRPLTARVVYSELIRLLGARGPMFQIPPLVIELPLRLLAVRKLLEVPREAFDYFNHEAHYDCANTLAALEDTGIRCPQQLDYLPRIVAFYQANKHRPEYRWKPY
jgi:thioester reductase-like protein